MATATLDKGLESKTLTGELTEQVYMQLLERRHSYMSRRVKQPLIRLWDKEFNFITRIADVDRWMWEEMATEDGTAEITFSGDHQDWLRQIVTIDTRVEEDLHITIDPDPDAPHDWKNRWGGKVTTIIDDETAGEAVTTTLQCVSHRRHMRGIYLAANPVFPMEVQLPKMYLWGGPCAFTCASSVFINLFRLYTLNGWWPIPRNVFAPETWLQNLSPLNWPVQVMPINPITDQSRWCVVGSRWKDAHTVLTPVMKDAGVICRAYTWLPDDPPPYTQFGEALAKVLKPTRACIILSFEDKSGVGGPTGTLIDGGLNLIAATLDDLITETIIPLDRDGDGETDPFFRKLLAVAPKPPPIVFRDIGYGNVRKKRRVIHKSQATDIIVGGKSPQWVNQAITFAIRYAISQLAQVIMAGPAGSYQQPGTEGLDNLYQGQLDDVFLAFQRFVNPMRSALAGSYAFREHFAQNTGTAYVLNAIQGIAIGDAEVAAYSSMKFDVGTGPYVWGQDYGLGDRVSAEIRNVVYTEQILAARSEGTRELAGDVQISFGDDSREENPIARGFRTIGTVANFAALLAGSGDVF